MSTPEDSILITIATSIGLSADYLTDNEAFNEELIISINTQLNKLNQLGIGTPGFAITGDTEVWADFLVDVPAEKQWMTKQYVRLNTKRSFDPPNSGILSSQLDNELKELEFRLLVDQED